ncbi:MAG: bifunctional nuclease domain-containing protein, partial [Thermacetogeniaceae bacterium]
VLINDFHDGTYYAELYLQTISGELILDARPSDAIALALRTGAQVYISEKVAEYTLSIEELVDESQQQELRRILGLNSPEDIKKSLH